MVTTTIKCARFVNETVKNLPSKFLRVSFTVFLWVIIIGAVSQIVAMGVATCGMLGLSLNTVDRVLRIINNIDKVFCVINGIAGTTNGIAETTFENKLE